MVRGGRLRGAAAVAFVVALLALLAGCISEPSGGPVISYSMTQGPGGQSQPLPQIIAQPPAAGWAPVQIVRGFLAASASFAGGQRIAREYLTTKENRAWTPNWSAVVYSSGPKVGEAAYTGTGSGRAAKVTVSGPVQAFLSGTGGYVAPSASATGGAPGGQPTFRLEKVGGQWRISKAPPYLVLTSYSFQYDYQLRNLYFFDPTGSHLVPDPVYVPLQATTASLMDGLVYDLIHPPGDWLSRGATSTSFPGKTTTIGDVTLTGGTAAVNLGGAIAKGANDKLMQQVSAQLLYTLIGSGGSGPAVQSVQLSVNGKPWSPRGSDSNPVQQLRQSKYTPANGAYSRFYYVDGAGDLLSRVSSVSKPVKVAHIGTGFTQIAVSPDTQYVAAVKNGSLFTGRVGAPLVRRAGDGYTSLSWDPVDDLWATTGDQIVMISGAASPSQLAGKPVAVSVVNSDGTTQNVGPFTGLRVAPDGVRVAIIVGGNDLDFGAFVQLPNARPGQAAVRIVLSQFYVSVPSATFTSLTWYGPDNVIALRDPGPELTEYPVNGGSSTSIPAQPHMSSITASLGNPLIASLPRGAMVADTSLSGSWTPVQGTGISAVYPG
ncbi:LpqB family beta-propeller domain-containing protein [Trebonia sp.]|uniref:LpqB family beta-propeller domain-containing protein n=1 Tax=Trebonia sp. TaxID=2767075 RepID=UPI003C722635